MAVTYGFYNALNHDRLYDAIQMSSIFDGIIRDGIFSTIGDTMIVTAPEDGMYVNVGSGRAWFNHTWTLNDTDYPIEAEQAEVVLDRIDAVILEVNSSAEVRANSIKFLKGTPSSNPVKPTLTHNAEVNQYALAYVRIRAGQTTIFQSDIENAVGTDETPFITGVLQQVSIETLLKQWEAEFNTYFTNFQNTSTTEFNNWFAAKVSEYTAWFAQMQTNMDSNFNEFDAWFQNIKDQLSEDAAGHLQVQIDNLNSDINALEAEMPFAGGSKVNINFEYNVIPNIQYSNEHYKLTVGDTVRENNFSSSKLHFDEYGILTVGDGILEVTYDVTDSRTGKVTHASYTYTINMPYFGRFAYNVTISASLYSYQGWLESIGKDASSYTTIEDVFADEKLLRELMTRHASVDYLVEWLANNNEDAHTVLNNDYCAKWINLRDYALDKLYANPTVKAVMDEVDKYGYGEWALVGQVPKMTSNTAPYGEAFSSSIYDSSYEAWKAFNGTVTDSIDCWHSGNGKVENEYIGYKFIKPTRISRVVMINRNGSTTASMSAPKNFSIQGSNDGVNWTTLAECTNPTNESKGESSYDVIDSVAYSMFRLLVHTAYNLGLNIGDLQFYAWQPKGNVPVMTSNTAPYGEVIADSVYSTNYAYNAFDNNDSTVWSQNTAAVPSYIGYKFTNPTMCKRLKITIIGDSTYGLTAKDYNVQASNDGSTWIDLTTGTLENSLEDITKEINFENEGYYLYYRFYVTSKYFTGSGFVVRTLQFYGRQLNVSVPKMTSNTAPWGEVIGVAQSYCTQPNLYKGFDNDITSTYQLYFDLGQKHAYVTYKFEHKMVLKYISIVRANGEASRNINAFNIQGSNDGSTFTDIQTIDDSVQTLKGFAINNNTEYKYYKFVPTTPTTGFGRLSQLIYYGLDYSEREFAEGSTMKYLYDHGVELEPITITQSSATAEKQSDCIYLKKSGTSVSASAKTANTINLTSYKLARIIAGLKNSKSGSEYGQFATYNGGTRLSYANIVDGLMPSGYMDISSVSQLANIGMYLNATSGSVTYEYSITEMWLE